MIKEMMGWKVLARAHSDNRISAIGRIRSPVGYHYVIYPPNEIVKPNLKNSKLFFFKDKSDAEIFCSLLQNAIIVPCIAYNCSRTKLVSASGKFDELFWAKKKSKKSQNPYKVMKSQKGSWVAEAIKCLA